MTSQLPFPKKPPQSILLLKSHSAGIGDLLRSSAAWRVLRNNFPQAQLHLWFLTQDPGIATEELISRHHLLSGFHVSDKRTRGFAGWKMLMGNARQIARAVRPELVVDCEPNGLRTTVLSRMVAYWAKAKTVGIAQVPGRGWFYTRAAPSFKIYARRHGVELPLNYADRDFVALAALGLERKGTPIELHETDEGRAFRQRLRGELGNEDVTLLGLNIGCGTGTAWGKRPNTNFLASLVAELQRRHTFTLLLTGAPHEKQINQEFLDVLKPGAVVDLAGRTSILELAGAIRACRLFISSDSGPYHMAVGLRVPTLALFNYDNPQNSSQHYHQHEWVECRQALTDQQLTEAIDAAERLLRIVPHPAP
jgi:ADP-heptose:LPS heptosyltransferase